MHQRPKPALSHSLLAPVNGNDATGVNRFLGLVLFNPFDFRMIHAQRRSVLELSIGEKSLPRQIVLFEEGHVPPAAKNAAAFICHFALELGHAFTPKETTASRLNFPADGRPLTSCKLMDGGETSPVLVSAGAIIKEILQGSNAHGFQTRSPSFSNSLELGDGCLEVNHRKRCLACQGLRRSRGVACRQLKWDLSHSTLFRTPSSAGALPSNSRET